MSSRVVNVIGRELATAQRSAEAGDAATDAGAKANLPRGFSACQQLTSQNDVLPQCGILDLLTPSDAQSRVEKQMRWAVLQLDAEEDASLEDAFDKFHGFFKAAKRSMSVARFAEGLYILLYKADRGVIELAKCPIQVAQLHSITGCANGGRAAAKAAIDFCTAWFATTTTSNFKFNQSSGDTVPAEEVYEDVSQLSDREYLLAKAEAKRTTKTERTPEQNTLVITGPEINAIRALDKRDARAAEKRKIEGNVVFHVGQNATPLEYPRDIARLTTKRGRTYNEQTEKHETRPFSEYAEGPLHMEKVLVLWGKGGRGKTQSARCIAKHLAIGHGSLKYVSTDNVDALKVAQYVFDEYVPIVLEELRADDISQHGRRLSANYLKDLFNVLDGGQCRVRNTNIFFHPRQPRIICINDKPEDWLLCIKDMKDSDQVPLERRLLFVEADEALIAAEAIAAHKAELDDVMQTFKKRKFEYNQQRGLEEKNSVLFEKSKIFLGSPHGTLVDASTTAGDSSPAGSSETGNPASAGDGSPVASSADSTSEDGAEEEEEDTSPSEGVVVDPLAGREKAALDYKAVEEVVREATADNVRINAGHWQHIADFLGHLVAASYASPELNAKTPEGYAFLPPVAFPHPNGENRGRTALAKEIVGALVEVKHQVFALVVWRYHNTAEAWGELRPSLVQFAADEDLDALRKCIEAAYGDTPSKSYLFSTGDGRRSSGGKGSWRAAVLTSLDAWWSASQRAAEVLLNDATTPDSWHRAFIEEIVPRLPCFGLDYWPKFLYGDIGHHVAPTKVDLQRYTIVGVGCRKLLQMWGLTLPKGGRAAQGPGLDAVRELQRCVAAVFDSGKHEGIEAAKREAGLRPLSAYDVQVQCCECKRGHKLPGRIKNARAALPE